MEHMLQTLHTTLKEAGFSMTVARQAVFRVFVNQPPQAMPEVIKRLPGIDRASVYRNVELFERLGILRKLPMGFKYKLELSDLFLEHHHHMICSRCGKTQDMPPSLPLEQLITATAAAYGYSQPVHILEVQGICASCQALAA